MNTEHLSPIRDGAAASHLVPRYLDSCANWRHVKAILMHTGERRRCVWKPHPVHTPSLTL